MGPADLDWNAVCYSARRTSPAAAGGVYRWNATAVAAAAVSARVCRASVQYTEMNVYSPSFVNWGENIFLCTPPTGFIGYIIIVCYYIIIYYYYYCLQGASSNVRPADLAVCVCVAGIYRLNTLLIIIIDRTTL